MGCIKKCCRHQEDAEEPLIQEQQKGTGRISDFNELVIGFSEIEQHKTLGEGYFGVVSKGKWRGADVAVKRLKEHIVQEDYDGACKAFKREVIMYSNIRHRNILQFMGVCLLSPNICIVLEYMEKGSVADIIHERREVVSWKRRLKWAIDGAKGMEFLHSHKPSIIHRDLKSHNLLVDENDLVKVGDFGTAKLLRPRKRRKKKKKKNPGEGENSDTTWAGTLRWAAPEVIPEKPRQEITYTTASDVYSFGVTFWEMVSKKLPFMEYDMDYEVMNAVKQGHRPDIPVSCPSVVGHLIESCWEGDPRKRPSFEDVLQRLTNLYSGVLGAEDVSINSGCTPSSTWPPLGSPKETNYFV